MKTIILKVPAICFIMLQLSPALLIIIRQQHIFGTHSKTLLYILPQLVIFIWNFSIVSYCTSELKLERNPIMLNAILVVQFVLFSLTPFFAKALNIDQYWDKYIYSCGLLFNCFVAVMLTRYVKKLFYARSYWFLFIEFAIPIIGMFTLTQEIQDWEKEKLETGEEE